LAKLATDQFGPVGIGWGFEVVREEYRNGQPYFIDSVVAHHEVIHILYVKFWYILDGSTGTIYHYGQTTFTGKRNNGDFFTDEEAPKKSLTDAVSKCLVQLGFAANIYMGVWDDSKYVNDRASGGNSKPAPVKDGPICKSVKAEFKRCGVKNVKDADILLSWLTNGVVSSRGQIQSSENSAQAVLDGIDEIVMIYPSAMYPVFLDAAKGGIGKDTEEFGKMVNKANS